MIEERVFFGVVCRKVPEFKWYWISRCGEYLISTYNNRNICMKPETHNKYLAIKYNATQHERLHRMVAKCWVEGIGEVVNHKDGNKLNNHADNLEWCSALENTYHALRNGLHNTIEKPIIGVHLDTGDGIWVRSRYEAARIGFHYHSIRMSIERKYKHHKRFVWQFA